MNILYRYLVKPILFRYTTPDAIHIRTTRLAHLLGKFRLTRELVRICFRYDHPMLRQTICGLAFLNPVGLSAGFDKDGYILPILPAVGFGFAQVGTVTWQPYAGNQPPHALRLPRSRGLLVNYGLKNEGITTILPRVLRYHREHFPVSLSIGKTNSPDTCDLAAGIADYVASYKAALITPASDFITLNISCPNTWGGEPFTTPDRLDALLAAIAVSRPEHPQPVFIKMPINLPWTDFKQLLDIMQTYDFVRGVIIGNLNKDRSDPSIRDSIDPEQKGSVSGLPTQKLCNNLIGKTYEYCHNRLVIIGVGGIFSVDDAYEKIRLGASLVQLITGMIYEGPGLVGRINRGLVRRLRADGYTSITEAIGSAHRSQ